MPDLWCDVDTAVVVPVNILPLLDDTDFKTIETAIVYNSAGLALTWNFVTSAGAVSGTAVTPTDGTGVYDWSEPIADKGMYAIEIPATGGGTINNDTEGVGWFTGVATGVLPWRGPTIGFRRAALNDLLIDGGTASTNLEDFFDGTGYAGGTAKLGVDVVNWKGSAAPAMTGDAFARLGAPAGASVSADVAAVKAETASIQSDTNDLQTRVPAALTGAGNIKADAQVVSDKTGYALSAAAIQAIWDALTAALTAVGSIGKLLVDRLDAAISSRSTLAQADVLSDATPFAGASVAAIKAKTDNLPSGVKKNTALAAFPFVMIDAADHVTPLAGAVVAATRSLDGGAFAACANAVAELSNGVYTLDLAAADLNGDTVILRFTAAGADDRFIVIVTEP